MPKKHLHDKVYDDLKNFAWDKKDKTIRGSFVNLQMTIIIMVLICIGAFVKEVRENLVAMTTLISSVFGISFTVWTYGKYKKIGFGPPQTPQRDCDDEDEDDSKKHEHKNI